MLDCVPGQRKRKRQQEESRQRAAATFGGASGHWVVIFETHEEAAWREYMRRLQAEHQVPDWSMLRVDTFCGRLVQPTTYRLSLFVPDAADNSG
ncbi:hypothetical protein [Nonomuraea sp. NPDC049784]|uniref:hypothetical protein n=1 Tax=Nonomuraea sp. NPDC049784 TaxID=3154361 RepID=UPI0033C656C9